MRLNGECLVHENIETLRRQLRGLLKDHPDWDVIIENACQDLYCVQKKLEWSKKKEG